MRRHAVSKEKRKPDAPKLTVSKKFGKYKTESEKKARKVKIEETEVLKQLKKAWKAFQHDWTATDLSYKNAVRVLKGILYSSRDIEMFSIALEGFQDEKDFPKKAGIFLSACINTGSDQDYTIHTNHLEKTPFCLCIFNTKNVVVMGDVSHDTGSCMQTGMITINGNSGNNLGERMLGGTITANGNVGYGTGFYMTGGSIHINGEIIPTHDYWLDLRDFQKGGRVYQNGKLIMENGNVIRNED